MALQPLSQVPVDASPFSFKAVMVSPKMVGQYPNQTQKFDRDNRPVWNVVCFVQDEEGRASTAEVQVPGATAPEVVDENVDFENLRASYWSMEFGSGLSLRASSVEVL